MNDAETVPLTFGAVRCSHGDSKVVVIPVPYDSTASYKTGMRHGPREIIDASRNMELYDLEFGKDIVEDAPVFTMDEIACSKKGPEEVVKSVEKAVGEVLESGKFPLVLGGEHSITSGAVNAAVKKFGNVSVLQIDAHTDLRDEYEGARFNHACVMRRVREICPNVVSVGIRSMCLEEAEHIKEKKLEQYIFGSEFSVEEVIAKIENKNVYVTFDLDGLDPGIMPATGTPEPGGILWKEATGLLKKVFKEKNVVGCDVVELCPTIGDISSAFTASKLCYKMMGYKFCR